MAEGLTLVRDRWYGWQSLPRSAKDDPLWACTPAFVCEVTALKTGLGRLRLDFIKAIYPGGACRQTIDFEVLHRDALSLVVRQVDRRGGKSIGIFCAISFGWMENRCSRFWSRFPGDDPGAWPVSLHDGFCDCTQYLAEAFGRDADALLHGITRESFGRDKPPMPRRHATIKVGRTYDSFDSYLIARGYLPREMEDKWHIYLERNRLILRRSWTEFLIYDVEAEWRGSRLHLGAATVKPPQFYAQIQWDYLVNGYKTVVVPSEELKDAPFSKQLWSTQNSGISIKSDVAAALERLWVERTGMVGGSWVGEENLGTVVHIEGGKSRVVVNRFERDPAARSACIAHFGCRCSACDVDLEAVCRTARTPLSGSLPGARL